MTFGKTIFSMVLLLAIFSTSYAQTSHAGAVAQLTAIYNAEDVWRKTQRGAGDPDNPEQVVKDLPSVTPATEEMQLAHWQGMLKRLDAVKVVGLSSDNRVNYQVFRAEIVVLINAQKFHEYEKPVNSDSQFWADEEGVAQSPFKTEQDFVNYLAQLKDLPRYFNENIAEMKVGLARGFTPPQVTLLGREKSIMPTADAKDAESTVYYKPLEKMPAGVPAARQAELRAEAVAVITASVIPAYKQLLMFFRDEYVPHAATALAAEALPEGKAYYESKILEFTTLTMSPEEIHAIGLSEMAKIQAEMIDAMKASGFKGTLPEFLKFLRSDPQFYAKTPEELLMRAAFIAKDFDRVSGQYFGYLPRERFGIVPVAPEIAPFYTSGRGGPGVYFVNTFDLPSRGLYSLPALTLHESAPGHGMQIPIATEVMKERKLPKFRADYISAYGEGWALYCERLGAEMGMYHTPYETFGMLSYQAWRAARLVVDTGLHSQGWTREQAQQYFRENTALSDHEIETEVDRYISWPGQALSYYLGEMAIWKARHKAEAALGAKFNIRAFHDAVLELGSVPLPVLEQHIDEFVKKGGVGPYPDMER